MSCHEPNIITAIYSLHIINVYRNGGDLLRLDKSVHAPNESFHCSLDSREVFKTVMN